ncbi:MAG: immunoglobulin domain-containing protein [Verrucomicrobia bacterium]|nr:immunoglobulin domain-containing protein [Verrucomicrobiota bacterium]
MKSNAQRIVPRSVAALAITMWFSQSILAGTVALQSTCPLAGSQNFSGSIGMDFDVIAPISVTKLGAFDSNQDGMKTNITVYIYDRDTMTPVAGPLEFAPGDEGTLVCASRWKTITPVTLNGGFHGSIVAENYGVNELLSNSGGNPAKAPTINTGNGRIKFVGTGRYGGAGSYPGTPDASIPNAYNAGTFEFEDAPGPVFTTQPLSQTKPAGGGAPLSAVATGGAAPLTYQWFHDGNEVPGATTGTLQLANISGTDAGVYSARATDANGAIAFSADASLVVAPAGAVLVYDQSTTTSANANSFPPGVGVFFNVVAGTSIQVTDLGFSSPSATISGTVTIQLFNAASATVLATVTLASLDTGLEINPLPIYLFTKALPSALILGPGSYAIVQYGGTYANSPVDYTINTGGGAIQHVGCKYGDSPGGPGALPTHGDRPLQYGGPTFKMTVSGAPAITGQPKGGAFVPGTNATLTVTAGGSLPLGYQWYKNGSIMAGKTDSTLTLNNLTTQDTADYAVIVSNSFGSVTSAVARVTVAIVPSTAIQLNPGIVITATPGLHYEVQYREAVDPPTAWKLLQDIPDLASSPYLVYDPMPVTGGTKRFYQVVLIP